MSKKSLIVKEKKKQLMVAKYRDRRNTLRQILKSPKVSLKAKMEAQFALQNLPKRSCACRLRNRCNVTGRARGYLRYFGISRCEFKEQALKGNIPGVRKSSW